MKEGYAMGRYFGTDGVRGVANTELTLEMAVRIGRYLGWWYSRNKEHGRILIGRDTRLSGSMFELGLAAGAVSSGADVYLLGVCPTPAVSHLVTVDDFDCGIMVSASHNPYTDNGIKIFNHDGFKMEEEVLDAIEDCIDGKIEVPAATEGKIGQYYNFEEGLDHYIQWLEETVPVDLSGYRIGVDLANGSSTTTAVRTLEALGAEVYALADAPDGLNINYHSGSTHPEALQEYVVWEHLDLGLAFDGDADRLIAVNSRGELVNGDYILYILGKYMNEKENLPSHMVVTTVMANLGLYKALEAAGLQSVQTPVGDKYVFEEMVRNGYTLGGEQSGHIIFCEYENTGDGLMTALQLLKVMRETGKTLEELSEGLFIYPQLLENVRVSDKNTVLDDEDIQALIEQVNEKLDGNGRLLVRPSGTEPLIRVMAEASTQELCEECVHAITDCIEAKGYACSK